MPSSASRISSRGSISPDPRALRFLLEPWAVDRGHSRKALRSSTFRLPCAVRSMTLPPIAARAPQPAYLDKFPEMMKAQSRTRHSTRPPPPRRAPLPLRRRRRPRRPEVPDFQQLRLALPSLTHPLGGPSAPPVTCWLDPRTVALSELWKLETSTASTTVNRFTQPILPRCSPAAPGRAREMNLPSSLPICIAFKIF